jgi:hypothetical protein
MLRYYSVQSYSKGDLLVAISTICTSNICIESPDKGLLILIAIADSSEVKESSEGK